ncbi:putative cytochrome c oxidase subunit 5b-like [Iris pallida]|uniref:Cytochrome c oxidase subunit 5b-like n=1 Tax=Iris pallida TaxID=29817 RepID=A0AAX6EW94_IRIPA|nr:putative cytochrome c oxidase subunit 5b-like [Iris pallida]
MDAPEGPFGTKEAPAVIQSYYDKRIVGCPGGEGEDEHDVVWFWLEKGKPHECPVCSQYFALEVIGEGGPPDGHGDDHHHCERILAPEPNKTLESSQINV